MVRAGTGGCYLVLEEDLRCYYLDLEKDVEVPVELLMLGEVDPDQFNRRLVSFEDGVLLI